MSFLPRDFVATREGLIFAVVDAEPEDGKVLGMLRYVSNPARIRPEKLATSQARDFLRAHHPAYLYHSARLDVDLHAVPLADIAEHYRPRERLRQLLRDGPADPMEAKLCRLMRGFAQQGRLQDEMGVTGSLLIGAHTPSSDFDLVVYGRPLFLAARRWVETGLRHGWCQELQDSDWREAYRRRGCALSFEDFIWHEQRKANKAMFEGTKFDLTQVTRAPLEATTQWRKRGPLRLIAVVRDASAAYDSPARYRIDHADVPEIVVHTHTYVGQARNGEAVEAAGQLEQDACHRRRLVVGTSREAPGEFLRVIHP